LEYYDVSTGSKVKVELKLEDNCLFIRSNNIERVIFIDFISSMVFKKDDKWNYLGGGICLILLGLFLHMVMQEISVDNKIILAVVYLLLIIPAIFGGILCLLYWWFMRCYTLEIYVISDKVTLNDRTSSLKELYDELIKLKKLLS